MFKVLGDALGLVGSDFVFGVSDAFSNSSISVDIVASDMSAIPNLKKRRKKLIKSRISILI